MTTEERLKFNKKYSAILKRELFRGLNLLNETGIEKEDYKNLIVNINNTNNILFQLGSDIETLEKENSQVEESN